MDQVLNNVWMNKSQHSSYCPHTAMLFPMSGSVHSLGTIVCTFQGIFSQAVVPPISSTDRILRDESVFFPPPQSL